MKDLRFSHLLIGIAMVIAAAVTYALTPRFDPARQQPPIELEKNLPVSFGDWKVDPTIVPIAPDPFTAQALKEIYTETLSRTYVNGSGERVMLSIAYGGVRSDTLRVHRPEGCYGGQGFDIVHRGWGKVQFPGREVPVRELVARKGPRIEPISYWIMIGSEYAFSTLEFKLAQMRYSFSGQIPDGMLFRVSSISADREASYRLHADFAVQMAGALSPEARKRLIGY